MRAYSRAELLALTPDSYLDSGFGDPQLTSTYATAASYQLLDGEVAPQELSFTATALEETLKLHDGAPADRVVAALQDALALVERMIGQSNNERLLEWLWDCADHVEQAEDIPALQAHITAVMQQYALLASLDDAEAPSSSSPS